MDINADIGEGYDDAALMPYLTRASIACGGHTGDPRSMDAALTLAAEYGVAVGAHPSYPDREGFGRREWAATPEQIAQWVTQQTEALFEIAATKGMRLAHIKPHGALYHAAAQHEAVAAAIAEAVTDWDAELILVGLSGSRLIEAGRDAGLAVMAEVFADRRYQSNGQLVSRETPGALITDPETAAAQAYALAQDQTIVALDGSPLRLAADTLCLHSDTPGAIGIARAVAQTLNRG
jgi:UPF0271 protein